MLLVSFLFIDDLDPSGLSALFCTSLGFPVDLSLRSGDELESPISTSLLETTVAVLLVVGCWLELVSVNRLPRPCRIRLADVVLLVGCTFGENFDKDVVKIDLDFRSQAEEDFLSSKKPWSSNLWWPNNRSVSRSVSMSSSSSTAIFFDVFVSCGSRLLVLSSSLGIHTGDPIIGDNGQLVLSGTGGGWE